MTSHVPISNDPQGSGAVSGGPSPNPFQNPLFRAIGSLWYAAVILMLLLVAMACATVYESAESTEKALSVFYRSLWFEGLLALLAVNVSAALLVRFPFGKRQVGFVITHLSILITLAGALITAEHGLDGQVGIAEGETVDSLRLPVGVLTVSHTMTGENASVDLASRDFKSFEVVEQPSAPVLTHGDVTVEVTRYLPDSELAERVVNDNPMTRYAILVSLSESGFDEPQWVFAEKPARIGEQNILFRMVPDAERFAQIMEAKGDGGATTGGGMLKVTVEGKEYAVAMSDCREKPAVVGDTPYAVRVLDYYPHASVGANNKIHSISDKPENPAVEVELTGPKGSERRLSFAMFPDFKSMHGETKAEDVKVVFVAPTGPAASMPIEIILGPEGQLVARFTARRNRTLDRALAVGEPVESVWPLQRFAVLDQYDHARIDWAVVGIEPRKNARVPALMLRVSQADETTEMWMQKFRTRPLSIGGSPFRIAYGDKALPLGFQVKLNKFHIAHYPGTMRPRSFESDVTITDPESGQELRRTISMNNPAEFGGLTLFQSRYRIDGKTRVTFLSVSRDPGMAVVFAGYIGMIGGMIIVLVTRATEQRKKSATLMTSAAGNGRHNGHTRNGRGDTADTRGRAVNGGGKARRHAGKKERVAHN